MKFQLDDGGMLSYELSYKNKSVIRPSRLGFELKDRAPLMDGFTVVTTNRNAVDTTWTPVWGEEKAIQKPLL